MRLAFVAALQLLPASQRAVLILREVLCWSSAEVAEFLDSSVPAHLDLDALAALLREDAILRMPPEPVEIVGRDAVCRFFATTPAEGRLDRIRLVATAANGQPALAAYLPDATDTCQGYGIMVLTTTPAGIAEITGFPDQALFAWFGLPKESALLR
ncbi:hypothetical protein OHA25_57735 [Nonomuraea sp. NBC_00507]|uniref:sigma factor-like helix-turn-helix DNA-binding protein n=1 Tax=Nonomuraea sp. NBC_00507 TaxID=2976002 RepID=UPI002E179B56